ncbi:hypothetical protein BU17DRAFT_64196 [Hysterangium stoloniferum]|nr:hypothetical protein BU17DRAFT_64196 [Hysterangium stoloniferum]
MSARICAFAFVTVCPNVNESVQDVEITVICHSHYTTYCTFTFRPQTAFLPVGQDYDELVPAMQSWKWDAKPFPMVVEKVAAGPFINLVRTVAALKSMLDGTSLRIHNGVVDEATITSMGMVLKILCACDKGAARFINAVSPYCCRTVAPPLVCRRRFLLVRRRWCLQQAVSTPFDTQATAALSLRSPNAQRRLKRFMVTAAWIKPITYGSRIYPDNDTSIVQKDNYVKEGIYHSNLFMAYMDNSQTNSEHPCAHLIEVIDSQDDSDQQDIVDYYLPYQRAGEMSSAKMGVSVDHSILLATVANRTPSVVAPRQSLTSLLVELNRRRRVLQDQAQSSWQAGVEVIVDSLDEEMSKVELEREIEILKHPALLVSTTSSGPTSISAPPKSMPQANNSPITSLAHQYLKESACKLSPGSYQADTSYIQLEKDRPLRSKTRGSPFLDRSQRDHRLWFTTSFRSPRETSCGSPCYSEPVICEGLDVGFAVGGMMETGYEEVVKNVQLQRYNDGSWD